MSYRSRLVLSGLLVLIITSGVFAQDTRAREFFDKGLQLVMEKKYTEGIEMFRRSVAIKESSEAYANIGKALLMMQRMNEAVDSYRNAVRLSPESGKYRGLLCHILSEAGRNSEAVTECSEAIQKDENSAELRTALIEALIATGRNRDALDSVILARDKFPANGRILELLAHQSYKAGNYTTCVEAYEDLLRTAPREPIFLINQAECLMRTERDAEAISNLRKVLAIDPNNPVALHNIGMNYVELGMHAEGVEHLRKAVLVDPKNSGAFYYLGWAESKLQRPDQAISAFQRAVELEPKNAEYQNRLGDLLADEERHEEAIKAFKTADILRPNDVIIKAGLGNAFMSSGRYDEAITTFSEADKLWPGNEHVTMLLRVARARKQALAQIDQMLAQAAKHPNDAKVRLSLLNLYTSSGYVAESEKVAAELLRIDPNDSIILTYASWVRTRTGKHLEAAELLGKAAKISGHHVSYLSWGDSLEKIGKKDEAMEAYKKAYEIKPDSAFLLKKYATKLMDAGRRQEALEMFKKAHAVEPTNATIVFDLGLLSAKLGNRENASQYLSLLKNLDPVNARVLARVIRLY